MHIHIFIHTETRTNSPRRRPPCVELTTLFQFLQGLWMQWRCVRHNTVMVRVVVRDVVAQRGSAHDSRYCRTDRHSRADGVVQMMMNAMQVDWVRRRRRHSRHQVLQTKRRIRQRLHTFHAGEDVEVIPRASTDFCGFFYSVKRVLFRLEQFSLSEHFCERKQNSINF